MKNCAKIPASKAMLSLEVAGYFYDYEESPPVSLRLYLFG